MILLGPWQYSGGPLCTETGLLRVSAACAAAGPRGCSTQNTRVRVPLRLRTRPGPAGVPRVATKRVRSAVRPQYRKPLRWGLKNPHSTYYVNVLRATVFPCLVYVNTVRDLDGLVSASKHFGSRVQEAMRFGVLGEKEGDALARLAEATPKLRTTVAMQAFYGGFVRDVNLNLEAWLRRCLPGRSVHVPLQRMVALAPRSPGCVFAVARPLALALRLEEAEERWKEYDAAGGGAFRGMMSDGCRLRLHWESDDEDDETEIVPG